MPTAPTKPRKMPTPAPSRREPVKPQPGPQELFLQSPARLAFYGGAAGGGKSYACLLEPMYHKDNPNFEAVIFRRIYRQIMAPGGLYRRSLEIYPQLGATFNKSDLVWTFPSGATVRFAHMQYEQDVESWKSSEIALIEVDEVTEMSDYQFFYLFSRNRSVSGVTPYMRAYCNPDPDSWVKVLLAPWVDDTWPTEDRAESGEIRWFIRRDDVIQWVEADHTDERGHPDAISLTFVRADLYDNKILMEKDPGYEAGLDVLPEFERRRLKLGDWNARPSGTKFKREWFKTYYDEVPQDIEFAVRFWDKAATAKQKKHSRRTGPDYTAGVLMGRRKEGTFPRYVVLDAVWEQLDPGGVEDLIATTATQDGHAVAIRIEQEPGASGVSDIFNFVTKVLVGYDVQGVPATGSKELRADPFSAQCKVGNVALVRGWWNTGYLNFLCAFPDEAVHDDPVDASSGGFQQIYLATKKSPQEHLAALKRRAELSQTHTAAPVQGQMPAPVQGQIVLPHKQKPFWEV
jgi:predicted phage terminase large subunit-like protein